MGERDFTPPEGGIRRVSLGRLAIALACPASHLATTEWVSKKSSWAARGGKGRHSALEVYPAAPDWEAIAKEHNLTARLVEMARNQYTAALPWLARHHRPTWRTERAYAFNPIFGVARELGKDENTLPGEWYGRFDVVDPMPDSSLFLDYKNGGQLLPPPRQIPQVWGGAAIVAQCHELSVIRGAILQLSEDKVEESGQTFSASDNKESLLRMHDAARAIKPGAAFKTGDHCTYCPAKEKCATHAAWKAKKPDAPESKEEPPMTIQTPAPSNVRPIAAGGARMLLSNVVRGVTASPVRVLVHGAEKVGKSTFAMGAPGSVFIGLEGGLEQLGPARFPEPKSFDDVMAAIGELRRSQHDFQSVVIDPVTWLEPMIFAKVCEEYGKSNIDEVLGGFQKGQARAVKYWTQLTEELDALRAERRMHVVLVSHTAVRNQKNPDAQDWGSWQPALDKNGADHLKRWVDAIVFARMEEFAKAVDGRAKGRSTGARVLLTQANAAYAAGNRFGIAAELPLQWAAFWDAVQAGHGKAEDMRTRARAAAKELGPEVVAKCEAYIAEAGNDVSQLAAVLDGLALKAQEIKQSA